MAITPADYEKLGQFYLGREYDAGNAKILDDLVLYDSKDLVTHGVVLGMTGSGKTGLCLTLLEEAAMDNIPAICIDPKGDISNIALLFPELNATSFRPWINEDDATRKGVSPDDFAASTAAMWQKGLGEWGQSAERISALRDKVDITIFTPGSKAGIPVSILNSLDAPPDEIKEEAELFAERVESTVSSLLTLVGVDADAVQSPEAVLLGAIFQKAWSNGQNLTIESLIRYIQKPNVTKVGVIDLDSFMPEKTRQALALKFNNLLASPGFASWLDGAPLDIGKMLHTSSGKPRISIFSIAHLDDAERMFFVSLLFNQMLAWMRSQNGTTSLRALLYMDEIFGFLPPSANPPSKRPLLTLLKQGRAFGLGCLLATQNPVDLDYKALSNIGTWFLGRLQTERDKMRVLDGLEGAAGSQNAQFNRGEMEKLISGLGNRVFLMNNVHEDHPVLFHVRWAMSYLTGPLTRNQIKKLMDPKRGDFQGGQAASAAAPADANPMAMPGMSAQAAAPVSARPMVGQGVKEFFVPVAGPVEGVSYRPMLLRTGQVHFSSPKVTGDFKHDVCLVNPMTVNGIDWEKTVPPPAKLPAAGSEPTAGAGFAELPGFAMNAANYKQVEKDFAEWLYRNERATLFSCPALKEWSKFDESEADFRARLVHEAREARDAAVQKLRDAAAKKLATIDSKLQTAEGQLAKQKAESSSAAMQAGVSVLGGILGAVFGRKLGAGTLSKGATSFNKASAAYKQHQDVTQANAKVSAVNEEKAALQADLEQDIAKISDSFAPESLVLETDEEKPAKTDVDVQDVGLLWLPYDERGRDAW